jgi:UDP-N-acetyl-D-glucosamine dehydrogenase
MTRASCAPESGNKKAARCIRAALQGTGCDYFRDFRRRASRASAPGPASANVRASAGLEARLHGRQGCRPRRAPSVFRLGSTRFPFHPAEELKHHFEMTVAVIGLGYVGLPLSLQFARSGVAVLGLDIDFAKIERLNAGQSYIKHIPHEAVAAARQAGRFEASGDFSRIREADAIIICVPTPLTPGREPDLSYVLDTARAIAPHLGSQSQIANRKPVVPLVVLESTTYPGTTEGELRAVLESGSGLKAGVDFHLAYSPEREEPGNTSNQIADIPKLVGGLTPACRDRAVAVYSRAVKTVVPVSSCRVAEAAKLLENIFRSVNIALVNELKVVYAAMGIDIWEVIAAAKTKPFGYMPFYPGPGLGGHCIPIDPFYLSWKAREFGQDSRFIRLAGEINTAMPHHVVARTAQALAARQKALSGSRILVLGLAYKADVDDDRESPAYHLLDEFKAAGATVAYHDPHVPVIKANRDHAVWQGTKSAAWSRETISAFDAAVICTAHRDVNYSELAQWSPLIVDTRNAMAGVTSRVGQVWPA